MTSRLEGVIQTLKTVLTLKEVVEVMTRIRGV